MPYPDDLDHRGHSLAHIACRMNAHKILEHILTAHPILTSLDSRQGQMPLAIATQSAAFDCITVLATHGVSLDAVVDRNGDTPLLAAIRSKLISDTKRIATIKHLCQLGANIRCERSNPLVVALVLEHRIDIIQALIDQGASVTQHAAHQDSPIETAIAFSTPPIIELLLDHGAEPQEGLLAALRRTEGFAMHHLAIFGAQTTQQHLLAALTREHHLFGRANVDKLVLSLASTNALRRHQLLLAMNDNI